MGDVTETGPNSETKRLWTPWRMNYVAGGTKEAGCIFCNRLERTTDVESLILYRAEHSFVIMNLYPYNTGHIMLVPNQHTSDPEDLQPDALSEMGMVLPTLTSGLRRAFGCHGFNVGLNIGSIAGAGVEAHLHQHIVPRWQGDANFMPIIASTMTIPELIPVTYAKIRAELTRQITGSETVRCVVLDETRERVLLHDGALPEVRLDGNTPLVQSVLESLPLDPGGIQLVGWAGPDSAAEPQADDITLTLASHDRGLAAGWGFRPVEDVNSDTLAVVQRAITQLAPAR